MSDDERDASRTYEVVINQKDQCSVWRVGREVPQGWRHAGKRGSKAECLAYIEQVWSDMRPRSLREQTDASLEPKKGS